MKNLTMLLIAALMGISLSAFAADAAAKKPAKGKLFHVVSIKFKDTATKEQIKAVEDAFRALKKKIPVISSLKWGTNVSPEKRNMGFTHCFILSFENEKDRDAYLVHPEHKAFGSVLGPVMADVFVIDFVAKKN